MLAAIVGRDTLGPVANSYGAMEKIVPLISSDTVGPLGIRHLPRLWLKTLLHVTGRLAEGYYHGNAGFDASLLKNFGIDEATLTAFVKAELPTYSQFEAWFVKTAKHLDPATIHAHNENIRTRQKSEEAAAAQRKDIGLEAPALLHGVTLNNLEDWKAFRDQLVGTTISA
jgi:hypothetical protein